MKRILHFLVSQVQTGYARLGAAIILALVVQPATQALAQNSLSGTKGFLDRIQNPSDLGSSTVNNVSPNPFRNIYDQISGSTAQGGFAGISKLYDQILQAGLLLLNGIAVIFVVASGIRMILESNNEDTAKKQTTVIFNIIAGMVIINIANFALSIVSPNTDVTYVSSLLAKFDDPTGVQAVALNFATVVVFPLLDFALSFLAGLAMLYIVYASMNIITHRGEEERIKEARNRVFKTVVGIVVILLNKTFVNVFYGNMENNFTPNLQEGINTAFGIANYILGFLGLVAVLALIYGGILIVSSGGDEKRRGQGMKILQYVLYGIILAMSAYTLTAALVGLSMCSILPGECNADPILTVIQQAVLPFM